MARRTLAFGSGTQALEPKLTGEPLDADRVRAVRAARPDVWLGVDANQGFTPETLATMLPSFVDNGVSLIEQPVARGREADLDTFESPIPLAADESVQDSSDLAGLVGRVDMINIKLDKCGGGLTEAIAMARQSQDMGFDVMVGNMMGTSLAMAPAYLVGQPFQVLDLDGVIFLRRSHAGRAV